MSLPGRSRGRALAGLAAGLVCISFGAILIRLTSSPAVTVAAWRVAIAGAALLPPFLLRSPKVGRRDLSLSFLSGTFLALHFAFWVASLRHTTVASSVVLVSTSPLFVGLLSSVLGERPSRAMWEGIALSTAGAALIGWGDFAVGGGALWGDALALLGAAMAAAYFVVGRRVRRRLGLLPYIAFSYGAAGVVLLSVLGILARDALLPRGGDWVWLVLLALGPQLLGHTSLNWALRFLPAAAVALVTLGEPVLSGLWAYLLFGEGIGPLQGAGFALVLGGIARGLGRDPGVT